ncbi:unnamed protein product, partial [Mycobacterium sp. PO2]
MAIQAAQGGLRVGLGGGRGVGEQMTGHRRGYR